ncbi:hypothetical protein Caci_7798 [Catenulispora acidiphila DSM 44928]|uniref:Uncharacterized protein n=1 Tax=Catenulispora acidiphila (strain DSM 44928 / JCM 14897 / NBRC 102108 / NRRL B-24433 / ID139908) TaxID=479433 RepID=C7QE34_CATAD|nr:hypothetical protein [Catenulispora acidiphila]ACU76622.1 hypothetical protein Caci_7798 [Catenulispora acidiphila DSM 44928]
MTDLIESEDELLDPQTGAVPAAPRHRLLAALHRLRQRTPLGSGHEVDPERRRRRTLAGLLALALVAGAGATGVAVHSRDLRHARAQTRDRMLLHLLGGSATLTLTAANVANGLGMPPDFQTPLSADFSIAVRNDGAKPLEVTAIAISVPGVEVLASAPHMTLPPGDAEALTSRITVDCAAANLPQYPSGVTLTVRTPATKGVPAGPATSVPMSFDPGHPAMPDSSDDTSPTDPYLLGATDSYGSYVTSSLYRLCGDVLAMMPSQVSATAVSGSPSPQNPVVSYSLHIDGNPKSAQMAVPLPKPPAVPGVTARTDLTSPQEVGSEGLDVNVTDRITDCDAFGRYLAVRGGATQASEALNSATPIGLQPVDPRFRTTPTQLAAAAQPEFDGITPGTADLQSTLLVQLAAACPDL